MRLLLAGVALVACAGAAWLALQRVRVERRLREALAAVVGRLEPGEAPDVAGNLSQALAQLRRAADASVERMAASGRLSLALSGALDAVPLGVVITDRAGETLFRNQAADSLLGRRAADALALRAVSDLLSEAVAGRGASRPLDLYGPPRRTLVLSAVPVRGAAVVVVEDVSERRRLEAVRRDFVANVSHELKTPVAALGLLAETLAGEDEPAVVQRLAGRMQEEAFRVARIIEDLLDLSRLEAEDAAHHEPVRIHEVVSQAVEHVRPSADLRGVHLSVAAVPRSWIVLGERRQLVSALTNLLENAVKYSDDRSEVELLVHTDGEAIDLVVRDHGIGIPSRDIDRIFERFYRVDRGRGRDTGGTGLGLSIVRHVASNHGGDVLVHSEEGEGSAFTLRLPAHGPVGLMADAG
ncbi:MAG: two-component sensor histidine kinase [Actinobacteria bacterium]|nr:two-component sensor histidine kinase [Actinomycetota bacterium]MBW3650115.1 two-component sensor histidine kinase [Actinomycetota bacterium]